MALHAYLPVSFRLIDLDVIRTFIECLDFSAGYDDDDKDLRVFQSWKVFSLSTSLESDETYDVINTNEGEKIFPKKNSICQLLLDVFGSNIKKNLDIRMVDLIWSCASSFRFLKWFMALNDSETLAVCKKTGRSPIRSMVSAWDNFRFHISIEMILDVVEFLVGKGASLQYSKNDISITHRAMGGALKWRTWCAILQHLEVDIPSFFEQETISWLGHIWSKAELMLLFHYRRYIGMNWEKYKWDDEPSSDDAHPIPTFWVFFLIILQDYKVGVYGKKKPDDDQDRTNEDRHAGEDSDSAAGEDISKNDDVGKDGDVDEDDDVDEIDNVDKDEDVDEGEEDNVEIDSSFVDYCYKMYQNWKSNRGRNDNELPMPGSFIP